MYFFFVFKLLYSFPSFSIYGFKTSDAYNNNNEAEKIENNDNDNTMTFCRNIMNLVFSTNNDFKALTIFTNLTDNVTI